MPGDSPQKDCLGSYSRFPQKDAETSDERRLVAAWQDVSKLLAKLDEYGPYLFPLPRLQPRIVMANYAMVGAISNRGFNTKQCIRWYVEVNCFGDMMVLHKELEGSIDKLNEAVLRVGERNGFLKGLDLDRNLIGTTI